MSELKQTATFKPFFVGGNSSSNNNNSSRAVNYSLQKFNDGSESQQQQQTGPKELHPRPSTARQSFYQ
jgi:hypothetical protein